MRKHETTDFTDDTEIRNLSGHIKQWAKGNDWYHTDIQTNQLRLEQTFGPAIESVAKELDYQNQPKLRRQVFDCYDMLMAKCRQIDVICRSGCRDEDELFELHFLKSKAIGAAAELADVLAWLDATSEAQSTKLQTNLKSQIVKFQNNNNDEWMTFSEAAEIIGVTKGTISKWASEGKFKDNGQKGQKRRLLKTSVLMVKQKIEDEAIKVDIKELREDARKLKPLNTKR